MQERLLQSEKMVSVGQLVSGVAHELNNPLTGIMGFAQLLQARDLDANTLEGLETIYSGGGARFEDRPEPALVRATQASRQGTLGPQRAARARAGAAQLRPDGEEHRGRARPGSASLPKTMVDPDQIQQVFLNLIINAEHAMISSHGKGTLTVRSRAEGRPRAREPAGRRPGHGAGDAASHLRSVLHDEAGRRGHRAGTDDQLRHHRRARRAHLGGQPARARHDVHDRAARRAGRGQGANAARRRARCRRSRASRVLVVDDEQSIRRLLTGILEMDGHRVDTAGERRGGARQDRAAALRPDHHGHQDAGPGWPVALSTAA